ncbi:MAG: ATP-binding protein [Candidatus Zipacnadales bacterium]
MDEQPLRVLVVDDDEDDYILTSELLQEIEGGVRWQIDWASSYEQALAAMARHEHDVYLLDYRLGSRTGLELLREAQAAGCKAPIILLTGQGDHAVDVEAMHSGATDYLVKGQTDASALERAIRYAWERYRVDRLRESLLTLASEELRNPMAAVKEEAVTLLLHDTGELSEKAVDRIGRIIQAADHCVRSITGLLDLALLEAGRNVELQSELIDVREMVEEAIEVARLSGRSCVYEEEIAENVGQIRGDRGRLMLVLSNLLSNAADDSPPGGVIEVKVQRLADTLHFSIADHGLGISPQLLEGLLRPFSLTHGPSSDCRKRMGLTLTHCKQLVEAHGGTMRVESGVGQGTTVYFSLPV